MSKTKPAPTKKAVAENFIPRIHAGPKGRTLPYRLVLPANYDAKKSYPLLLFLHGSGERGDDNGAQLRNVAAMFGQRKFQSKFPCFVVVPQCPEQQHWGGRIRGWPASAQMSTPLRMAMKAIDGLAKEFSVDKKRIYIAGLSMGGYGVWDAIVRFPKTFAAGIVCCGAGDAKTMTAAAARVPLWSFHSDDDTAVSVEGGRKMVAAMRKKGGKPKYTEYQGIGHNCWDRAFAEPELLPWLFKQRLA